LQRPFSEFVSNPTVQDGSPGYRVRPSSDEIEALITAHRGFPEEERQTHFRMQSVDDDGEVNAVLILLARVIWVCSS
jgi:hypothetical protein